MGIRSFAAFAQPRFSRVTKSSLCAFVKSRPLLMHKHKNVGGNAWKGMSNRVLTLSSRPGGIHPLGVVVESLHFVNAHAEASPRSLEMRSRRENEKDVMA
jgi:hypothetical protein